MDSFLYLTLLTLLTVCIKQGRANESHIVLSSLTEAVLENSSVALTCSNTTGILVSSSWYTSLYDNQQAYCYRYENSCQKISFLNNNTLFDCICNDNGSYTVLLKRVDRYQHGSIWMCGLHFKNSTTVVINISVPVTQAILTRLTTEPVYENTTANFKCATSYSLPSAQVKWYRSNSSSTVEITGSQNVDIKRETQTREDNVICVIETLSFGVNRSVNGWNVHCTATNWQKNIINSRNISLSVLYPPDRPPVIDGFSNGNTYTVVEDENASLSCSVTGGNPLPKLEWHCERIDNKTSNERIDNETVTSYLSWTAKRTSGKTCICITGHVLSNVSSYVNIDVLYPPSLPDFYIHLTNGSRITVSSKVNITENSTLTMNCSSESNPVSTYSWTGPKTSNNETLIWDVINNKTEGSYTCTATNNMTQTNGPRLEGKTNNSILVNVLYPPSDIAFTLRNQTTNISVTKTLNMFENVSYILTCHARGKPDPTYRWIGPLNFASNILNLTNVNRDKAGNYTCEAKNTIYESTGVIHNGGENESIYLNIQYASEVTEFFIDGHREGNTVITNQGENATFHCNVDSNPNSSVSLQFRDKYLSNNTNTRNLTYFVKNLPCSSAGIYYCFSSNEVNYGNHSWKRFTLIVKCPPLPEKNLNVNVTSLKYVPATLSFKALDFLDSDKTSFTWEKQNNTSKWETVKNDTKEVNISTFKLQTNLTVINVTGQFSGNYRVIYNNSVGGNTQMFQLSVADLPDTPTYFDYLKESLTFNQVTVVWTKGFGGGLRQTFVLNIFQTSQLVKYDKINETENEKMKHTITGLLSGTQYDLTLWATNSVGKSLSQTLTIVTKEVDVHSSAALTAPIAGSVSGVVAIVAGVFVAFMLYKRRTASAKKSDTGRQVYQNVQFEGKKQMKALPAKAKTHDVPAKAATQGLPVNTKTHDLQGKIKKKDLRGKTKKQEETSFQDLQEVDDIPTQYNERTEYYNSAEKIAEIEKIKVSELLQYVIGRGEESFETEYQKLPTGLEHPCTFARKPENIALNRYQGIYPYDHSRVKIEGMPEFFINACYINGYTKEKEYIASLGPTIKVTYDFQTFWLMVWNERSDIIVMLTNLHEPSGMKCEQYWPEYETTQFYGDVQVSSDREEVFAEYTVRVFTVSNSGERRTVTHLHYTAWPDKKVPEDVTTLIEFRERLKATDSVEKGPVIVHCSAGIGRTGTLIALDRLIKEGQNESAVDVFKCVNSMREQRVKMVQTLEQYIYIYKALVNSLYFNCETIPLESFNEYVDTTNNNIYSNQFQQLKDTVEDCIKDKSDTHAESEMLVDKNRRGADIPGRQFRVLVYLNRNLNDSDYVNAVYANSFRIKDHFILAQTPLPNTVTDFVCMMYQEKCCCVVTMEDLNEPGMKVGHYLPTDGQPLRFGHIQISCTVLEQKPQYTVREMRLQNNRQTVNREKVVYHFHYTKWMQGNDTPTDAKEFVQFIKDVEDYADQLGEEQSHVLVHCLKANERSALYSIVTILTEKMRYERQVSVLNTVRHLRTRRRTAITSMEQLKFCYQAVKAYINLFES